MDVMKDRELPIMGKRIQDMYGALVGKAIGTETDIEGTITAVGIDCGFHGFMMVKFDQLLIQDDTIIYLPRWRLDSQKILREKGIIARRLKALKKILAENSNLQSDGEFIKAGYEEKLASVNEIEDTIKENMENRLSELKRHAKTVKSLLFEATIQHRSEEIDESSYKEAKAGTNTMLEHIEFEISEIEDMQKRLQDLADEMNRSDKETATLPPEAPTAPVVDAPPRASYPIPEPPTGEPKMDWLSRMSAQ